MTITARDVVPFSQARARLSDLVDEVMAGSEKIITRNGESCAALIVEVENGLSDVTADRVNDARQALTALRKRRATAF